MINAGFRSKFVRSRADSGGYYSLGNTCPNYIIGNADIIYVTGIIRDFYAAYPDMNKGNPMDPGSQFISATISA